MSKGWTFELESTEAQHGYHNDATAAGHDDGSTTLKVNGSSVTISRETSEMLGLVLWKHSQRTKAKD